MAEKKKTAAKKTATKKKTTTKKAAPKKAAAKKTTKKAATKKVTKKAAPKKTTAKKKTATKKTTKKVAAKKTTTKKKAAPKKTTTIKKSTVKAAGKKVATKPAKKSATKTPAKTSTKKSNKKTNSADEVKTSSKKNGKADNSSNGRDRKGGDREKKNVEATPEMLAAGEKWLNGLFKKMDLKVKASGKIENNNLEYDLEGKGTETLLGPSQSAKSLESISTILKSSIIDSRSPIQINVDVNGLKEERSDLLSGVAEELAKFAQNVKQAVTVAGLNSFERKAIHQTLTDDKRVSTESDGMGVFRKIRLEPRK